MDCHVSFTIEDLLSLCLEDIEKKFNINKELLYNYYFSTATNPVPLSEQVIFHIDYKDGTDDE